MSKTEKLLWPTRVAWAVKTSVDVLAKPFVAELRAIGETPGRELGVLVVTNGKLKKEKSNEI